MSQLTYRTNRIYVMPPQLKQNLRRILSRFFDATSEFNNAFHAWQFRFFSLSKVKESRLPCFQSGKDGKCPHLICIRGWVSFLLREMPQASPHRRRVWAACECENIPLAKLKQLLSHSSCTLYVGHAPFLTDMAHGVTSLLLLLRGTENDPP